MDVIAEIEKVLDVICTCKSERSPYCAVHNSRILIERIQEVIQSQRELEWAAYATERELLAEKVAELHNRVYQLSLKVQAYRKRLVELGIVVDNKDSQADSLAETGNIIPFKQKS
jgi:hypothetical protein